MTDDVGIINKFLERIFGAIDSGFGLISGDVGHLFNMLIILNIVLAGLWWAYGARDAIEGLLRRVLMIGFFAFVLNNWAALSSIIFQSFAILGLKASGDRLSLAEFMDPGAVALLGVKVLVAFSDQIGQMSVWDALFDTVLLILAAIICLAAFFIIAIQIFVSLVIFKISTLAAFTLMPFAIFGKTSFIAERPLGYIVSAGVRLFVLAALVSISYDLFSNIQLTQFSMSQALGITLGAVTLAVLSFVAPRLAGDIISGGPSLGGGAALAGAAAGAMVGGAGLSAMRSAAGALLGGRGSGAVAAAAMALPAPSGETSAIMSSGSLLGSGSRASTSTARGSNSVVAASSPILAGGSTVSRATTPSTASGSASAGSVAGAGPTASSAVPSPHVSGAPQANSGTRAPNADRGAGIEPGSAGSGWLSAGLQAATQPLGSVAPPPPRDLQQTGRSSGASLPAPVAGASPIGADAAGVGGAGPSESQQPQASVSSATGIVDTAAPLSIGPAPQPHDRGAVPWQPTLMEQLNQVRLATPDGDGGAGIGVPIQHPKDD